MMMQTAERAEVNPLEILLVEDNPGDVFLLKDAFDHSSLPVHLGVTRNGEDALAYLRHAGYFRSVAKPHLILLDLNLPKKDGRDVLYEIKQGPALKPIPVVILTTSAVGSDVEMAYRLNAESYLVKPVDARNYSGIVKNIEDFWAQKTRFSDEEEET